MPVYEYKCPKCGVIEVTQSINDVPIAKCPSCRRKVKRLISLNNFHLKGSGWYATDYAVKKGGNGDNGKAAGQKGEHKEEKPSKTTEPSKSDTSTPSKPSDSKT